MMECVNGNMFKELSVFIVFECWLGRKKKKLGVRMEEKNCIGISYSWPGNIWK